MTLKPANMDECEPKCKCFGGDNNGQAYNCEDPCAQNYVFNEITCNCDAQAGPPGEYTITYWDWEELWSVNCPGSTLGEKVADLGNDPGGAPLSYTINAYETGPVVEVVTPELLWMKDCNGNCQPANIEYFPQTRVYYTDVDGNEQVIENGFFPPASMRDCTGGTRATILRVQFDTITRTGDNPELEYSMYYRLSGGYTIREDWQTKECDPPIEHEKGDWLQAAVNVPASQMGNYFLTTLPAGSTVITSPCAACPDPNTHLALSRNGEVIPLYTTWGPVWDKEQCRVYTTGGETEYMIAEFETAWRLDDEGYPPD